MRPNEPTHSLAYTVDGSLALAHTWPDARAHVLTNPAVSGWLLPVEQQWVAMRRLLGRDLHEVRTGGKLVPAARQGSGWGGGDN